MENIRIRMCVIVTFGAVAIMFRLQKIILIVLTALLLSILTSSSKQVFKTMEFTNDDTRMTRIFKLTMMFIPN